MKTLNLISRLILLNLLVLFTWNTSLCQIEPTTLPNIGTAPLLNIEPAHLLNTDQLLNSSNLLNNLIESNEKIALEQLILSNKQKELDEVNYRLQQLKNNFSFENYLSGNLAGGISYLSTDQIMAWKIQQDISATNFRASELQTDIDDLREIIGLGNYDETTSFVDPRCPPVPCNFSCPDPIGDCEFWLEQIEPIGFNIYKFEIISTATNKILLQGKISKHNPMNFSGIDINQPLLLKIKDENNQKEHLLPLTF